MSARTRFLSRLMGLYCILVGLSMVMRRQASVETVTALLNNAPALFVVGAIVVIGGLAMVLAHNVWRGGALPVVVTLVGWMTLIKGLVLLFLSPAAASGLYLGTLHYEQFFYEYIAFSMLLGIYLTWAGFRQACLS